MKKDVFASYDELLKGYSEGIITDRECADMLDLLTNSYTVVVDDSVDDIDFWEVCQGSDISEFSYDLEASQYDYL
tara:strand:+ start:76 stop:300 length:225 start_codon:yes stop_codon:yes gene_type:complete